MIGNEGAFQKSLDQFAQFDKSGELQRQERDYKERLIRILGGVLSNDSLAAGGIAKRLDEAIRNVSKEMNNLTRFNVTDNFKRYVNAVPEQRLIALLRDLFNEEADLVGRFDEFYEQLSGDFRNYLPPKREPGWLTAVLLTARNPKEYVFYRYSPLVFVNERWGLEIETKGSRGLRYVAYLELLKGLKEKLTPALGRAADLIDAQSFLWVTYNAEKKEKVLTWQEKLALWLRSNPKVTPNQLRELREQFVSRFPKEEIRELTLDQYLAGKGSKDSFCYWLAYKMDKLAGVGRTTGKWGVEVRNGKLEHGSYKSVDEGFAQIKKGLQELYTAAEQQRWSELDGIAEEYLTPCGSVVRGKPLSLYFPDEFLSIFQPQHLRNFLSVFKIQPIGELFGMNRQLLEAMRAMPEFDGFDPQQMTRFLYSLEEPSEEGEDEDESETPVVKSDNDREIRRLLQMADRTGNLILYGPPGTGKTFIARQFTKAFLAPQLESATSSEERRIRLLQGLKWYDALALTMAMASDKQSFKVAELLSEKTLKDYAQLKKAEKLSKAVWAQLQIHTSLDSKTVNYASRHPPFLFDKDASSLWSLTDSGREYVTERLSEELEELRNPKTDVVDISNFYEFVTFHQSFAYEEFIEGLKPLPVEDEGEGIKYDVLPGVFRRICERAEGAWKKHHEDAPKYLLIIDEINRANIAKVFGELITLLEDDKRLGRANKLEVRLPYSGDRFGVPPNLYILGTMNTADRSIALLDLALRRRFAFVELMPDPSLLATVAGVDLVSVLTILNERVTLLLDRDHQIGHSYFLGLKDANGLHFAWNNRVVPLLQEYFYNDGERLYAVLGDGFLRKRDVGSMASNLSELIDMETPRYELRVLSAEELVSALNSFIR